MQTFTQSLTSARNSAFFPVVMIGLWVYSIFKQVKMGSSGPIPTAWTNAKTYRRNVT